MPGEAAFDAGGHGGDAAVPGLVGDCGWRARGIGAVVGKGLSFECGKELCACRRGARGDFDLGIGTLTTSLPVARIRAASGLALATGG